MRPIHPSALLAAFALLAAPVFAEESPPKQEPAAPPVLDFGDHGSATLATKAWDALNAGKHAEVDGYAAKCIELYGARAQEMQKGLSAAAPAEKANEYWALNDVGTCHFIRATSREARGDKAGALADYRALVEKFAFAQCWDTKGWFWRPADTAREKLKALEFDALE